MFLAATALAITALIAAACGDDDDETTPGDNSSGEVAKISMTMSDDLAFDPAAIEVKAGERVRLNIDNAGTALHDFTIEEIAVEDVIAEGGSTAAADEHGGMHMGEFDLHLALDGGKTGMLEFTPMETGEYQFSCTEVGHADAGMMGTLTVK
jgi:uncharacterized cupredoxin-like copper-binding protein